MSTLTAAQSCQPWPSPPPATFRPGTCYSFAPHAAPWHLTVPDLGWVIVAFMVAAWLLGIVQDWFDGQYEVTRKGRLGVRVTRRWYGTRAWVARRGHRHEDDHHRYQVIRWDSEGTDCPWLLVQDIDDDGAEVTWEPVTRFVPEAVRKLRPWIFHHRWLRLPVLFDYKTLPWPSGRPSGWPKDGA
jgi:hypothetical protein